ncbi:flavodoxin family protein [Myxococcota bacterium]|nr:flavodoxin family protein [Myxococcota bacterium]MBU1536420.1 flavodoxin family protein [Myxococcota bacterium]
MRILAINGSPRKGGNSEILIGKVFKALEAQGFETELYQLGGQAVHGCRACGACKINLDRRCVITGDPINEVIEKMIAAQGIIIASPVYFSNVTTETKALIDRAGYVCRANGYILKRKVAAAVVAVRRAGALVTFNAINQFFHINQMIIPGSTYWNLGIGGAPGEVEADTEGLINMENLGENMGWLLRKLAQDDATR